MFNSKDYKGIATTESFQNAMNDDKYASKQVGSNPSIEEGMVITGTKLDFFKNVQTYGQDAYDELSEAQQNRCEKQEDGTYKSDNSFFGMQTTGALGRVSFTSLVGYCQYQKRLTTDDKKALTAALKAAGKTEKDIVSIRPGGVDFVAQQVGGILGQPLTIVKQFHWTKGWKQSENAKPIAFDQRMDIYCK